MRIVGSPSADRGTVAGNLAVIGVHERFGGEMLDPLWEAGLYHGIDPVVMIGQAGHETNWGHFTGKVPATFRNPCGLKTRFNKGDDPIDHERFGWWRVGAWAHAQHLCAYAGQPVDPLDLIDPRFDYAQAALNRLRDGRPCEQVEELGGMWAPREDYGRTVAAAVRRVRGW